MCQHASKQAGECQSLHSPSSCSRAVNVCGVTAGYVFVIASVAKLNYTKSSSTSSTCTTVMCNGHKGTALAYPLIRRRRRKRIVSHLILFLNGAHRVSTARGAYACPGWSSPNTHVDDVECQTPRFFVPLYCPTWCALCASQDYTRKV